MPSFTCRTSKFIAVSVIALLPLSVAACTSDPAPTQGSSSSAGASSAPPASPATTPSPSTPAADAGAAFGPGCSSVPTTGKGSFDGMSSDPVATAADNNPLLSTLVTAVKTAGLVDTLNNAEDVTVFAPDNDAFGKINAATLAKVLADKSQLTGILTLHVVPGRLAPADLAGTHKTLNGQSITVTGSGEDFTVNDSAKVVCGNVQTANATVYIIDSVLMPR